MLKDKKLRVVIIQLHYNILVTEHRGRQKTMELVTRNYQQPKVNMWISIIYTRG